MICTVIEKYSVFVSISGGNLAVSTPLAHANQLSLSRLLSAAGHESTLMQVLESFVRISIGEKM